MKVFLFTKDRSLSDTITGVVFEFFSRAVTDIECNKELENLNDLKGANLIIIDSNLYVGDVCLSFSQLVTEYINSMGDTHIHFLFLSNNKQDLSGFKHLKSVSTIHYNNPKLESFNYKMTGKLNELVKHYIELRNAMHKTQLCFIHGFNGGEQTWSNLIPLIKEDEDLKNRFKCDFYNYPSFSLNPIKWIKNMFKSPYDTPEENAAAIKTKIETDDYKKVILVAHSLGAILVRVYLVNYFSKKNSVKKIILFAPAHSGSNYAIIGKYVFLKNKLIPYLVPNCIYLKDLNSKWDELGLESQIFIKAIVGYRDSVISLKNSKKVGLLPNNIDSFNDKNHISIKSPINHNSYIYKRFKQHLLK